MARRCASAFNPWSPLFLEYFPEKWIGRPVRLEWPSRSPDLKFLHCSLWILKFTSINRIIHVNQKVRRIEMRKISQSFAMSSTHTLNDSSIVKKAGGRDLTKWIYVIFVIFKPIFGLRNTIYVREFFNYFFLLWFRSK